MDRFNTINESSKKLAIPLMIAVWILWIPLGILYRGDFETMLKLLGGFLFVFVLLATLLKGGLRGVGFVTIIAVLFKILIL